MKRGSVASWRSLWRWPTFSKCHQSLRDRTVMSHKSPCSRLSHAWDSAQVHSNCGHFMGNHWALSTVVFSEESSLLSTLIFFKGNLLNKGVNINLEALRYCRISYWRVNGEQQFSKTHASWGLSSFYHCPVVSLGPPSYMWGKHYTHELLKTKFSSWFDWLEFFFTVKWIISICKNIISLSAEWFCFPPHFILEYCTGLFHPYHHLENRAPRGLVKTVCKPKVPPSRSSALNLLASPP